MPDSSHSRSLRTGRYSLPGQIYMVTATTLDRVAVFDRWTTGRLLVNELRAAQQLGLVNSLAWVVMPDHLHWLFELRSGELSKVIQRVKSRTAKAVNQALGREGQLWQDGYHDTAVRREDDIVHFARYIVANPLRAGLVKNLGDYPLWDAVWVQG